MIVNVEDNAKSGLKKRRKMRGARMSAYINETVLCGDDGFKTWDEKGNFGNCFQDLILVIPSQVSLTENVYLSWSFITLT